MRFVYLVLVALALTGQRLFGRPPARAHAIADSQLFFRTSGAGSLTQTETSATLTINGTPMKGLGIEINIPQRDVGDTVRPTLEHSTNGSTWTTLLSVETVASITETSTVPVQIRRTFHTRNKYVRLILTVAGTSPDFGAVNAFISVAPYWQTLGVGQNASSNP